MLMKSSRAPRFLGVMAGLAMAVGLTSAASASERSETLAGTAMDSVTRTTAVSIADLDLGNPAAGKKLEMRLKIAAGQVCDKGGLWTLRPPADYVRCFDAALADAHTQLGQRTALDNAPIRVSAR